MIKTDTRAETFAPNSFMQNHQKIIEFIFYGDKFADHSLR